MRFRAVWLGWLIASLGCAGTPSSPAEDSIPTSRAELARALVEAGVVRESVSQIVTHFRELASARVEANVETLESELEQLPADRRDRARSTLVAMPARFEGDLTAFLESIDFEGLAIEIYHPIYADRFDVDELQAILRFYRSPAGQAFAREEASIGAVGTAELAARLESTLETFMRQWFDQQLRGLQVELAPGNEGSRRP